MIVFRNIFCYSGWKSLHIPIAIIKSSGLNVFICIYTFCGRRGTKKCSSNQNARSERFNWLSYLPVNVYICIPMRTRFAQTGYVISAITHAVQTERERQANIKNHPGIVALLLTVSPAVPNSSPCAPRLCIFCMSLLVNTPDSDNQLVRRELRAWTVFRLTCSLHSVLCSLLPEQGKSVEVYFTSEHSFTDLRCAAWHNIPL